MKGIDENGDSRWESGLGAGQKASGARRRLVELLREIAELAGERSLKRCPYRSARDSCTFRGECGNRYRASAGKALCTCGPLNARGASAEDVAAALEEAGVALGPGPGTAEHESEHGSTKA